MPSRVPDLRVPARSTRGPRKDAPRAVTIAAARAMADATATVRQSVTMSSAPPSGRKRRRSATPPHCASSSPPAQPSSASTTHSTRACRASRPRLTPRASRTAVSRRRRSTRASIRLMTLAHAISSTITATPRTQSAVLDSSPASGPAATRTSAASARGFARVAGGRPGSIAFSAFQLCSYAALKSASAASRVTPGLRRTSACIQPQLYRVK